MKYELWLMALSVLQICDVMTTERILRNGGTELNPAMAYLFAKFGITKTLIAKAIVVFCVGVMLLELMPIVLVFLTIVYIGVVAWNAYQIWGK